MIIYILYAFIAIGVIVLLGHLFPPLHIKNIYFWFQNLRMKTVSYSDIKKSPLLYAAHSTGTAGDIIHDRLYFLIPLSSSQRDWLNQLIIKTQPPIINKWSITHLVWGMISNLIGLGFGGTIVVHTLFELWEALAFEYGTSIPFTSVELLDGILDTLWAILGYLWIKYSPLTAITFALGFNARLFSQ